MNGPDTILKDLVWQETTEVAAYFTKEIITITGLAIIILEKFPGYGRRINVICPDGFLLVLMATILPCPIDTIID